MTAIRKTVLSLVMASATFLSAAPDAEAGFVPLIAGTWQISGTPNANPCGINDPFTNVAVISFDGTIVNSDPAVGTAVGEVFRTGRFKYGVGFFGAFSPAQGVLVKYEVQGTLNANWDGTATGQFRTILTQVGSPLPPCVYEGTISAQKLSPMSY